MSIEHVIPPLLQESQVPRGYQRSIAVDSYLFSNDVRRRMPVDELIVRTSNLLTFYRVNKKDIVRNQLFIKVGRKHDNGASRELLRNLNNIERKIKPLLDILLYELRLRLEVVGERIADEICKVLDAYNDVPKQLAEYAEAHQERIAKEACAVSAFNHDTVRFLNNLHNTLIQQLGVESWRSLLEKTASTTRLSPATLNILGGYNYEL